MDSTSYNLPKELVEFIASKTGYPRKIIIEILLLEREYYGSLV